MKRPNTWIAEVDVEVENDNYRKHHSAFCNYYKHHNSKKLEFSYRGRFGEGIAVIDCDYIHHAAIITYYIRER